MRRIRVVAALIEQGDRVLLDRRHEGPHAGRWEFPGGKVEPGESDVQALLREIEEELGVRGRVGAEVGHAVHREGDTEVTLVLYRMAIASAPEARDVAAIRWFRRDELPGLEMPPADVPLVQRVLER